MILINYVYISGYVSNFDANRLCEQARLASTGNRKEQYLAMDNLEVTAKNAKSIAERKFSSSSSQRLTIDEACDEVLSWLKKNKVCFFLFYPLL